MQKKTLQLLISLSHAILALSVPLLFLLTLPKHRSMSILFAVCVLVDGYITYWYKKNYRTIGLSSPTQKYILPILHSLSYIALITFLCVHCVENFAFWSPFWRTYGIGILFLLYMSKGVLFAFMLLQDLLRGLWRVMGRRLPSLFSPKKFLVAGIIFSCITGIIGVYSSTFTVFSLDVKEIDIVDHRLPPSFEGYRIAMISDLHIGSQTRPDFLQRLGENIRSLDPDLLVFTGDMLNFHSAEVLPFFDVLQSYRAKEGIFCVLGNHDYATYLRWDSPQDSTQEIVRLKNIYKALNWTLLRNQSQVIYRGEDSIVLAGVEMYYKKMKRNQKQLANTCQSLEGIGSGAYTVLLSHNPQIFETDSIHSYPCLRLVLSGHTHGGQMVLPLGSKKKLSPVQLSFTHWQGHYQEKDKHLYVNTGTGFNAIPFRWFVSPELTLLTLKK